MKTAELFFCAAVAAFSACAETQVLIVHEKVRVDEWRVTVYVGDSRGDANGAILKYSPEGKFLGVLASVPARPEALAIRDGFLYVCSAFGPNANQLFRYSLSDGKGGVYLTQGLSVPRTLAFGADGLLYTANCASARRHVAGL